MVLPFQFFGSHSIGGNTSMDEVKVPDVPKRKCIHCSKMQSCYRTPTHKTCEECLDYFEEYRKKHPEKYCKPTKYTILEQKIELLRKDMADEIQALKEQINACKCISR